MQQPVEDDQTVELEEKLKKLELELEGQEHVLQSEIFALKGKRSAHLSGREPCLELVFKKRQGKCFGAAKLPIKPAVKCVDIVYATIDDDIWFHVAEHIAPETVLTFSLICRQTAAQVQCKRFWKRLYKTYCQKKNNRLGWNVELPKHLQSNILQKSCTMPELRQNVVQALFHCYPLFKERQRKGHTLESLIGSVPISVTYDKPTRYTWFACYKLSSIRQPLTTSGHIPNKRQHVDFISTPPVVHWESLLDNPVLAKNFEAACNHVKQQNSEFDSIENLYILAIYCKNYVPPPMFEKNMRLKQVLNKLNNDMCSKCLELQFENVIDESITKVQYPCTIKYFVIPWWYTSFKDYDNLAESKLNVEF